MNVPHVRKFQDGDSTNSKINGTHKGVYLPISELHSILAITNLLAHNNLWLLIWASRHLWRYHLICWWCYNRWKSSCDLPLSPPFLHLYIWRNQLQCLTQICDLTLLLVATATWNLITKVSLSYENYYTFIISS